ncbi:HDIG domain protein [Clostridiales bacterium oral taxon 876 str. F0540]|nr:HDIG domain protein [Clostridiales bacterium oral taxon 876 str. F0540]
MSIYRIKQFYWSVTAKIDLKDREIINKYLDKKEQDLFSKLSEYEQKHCVNVARDIMNFCIDKNISSNNLIRAGLLHDIGKIYNKLNPIEKSLVVMLDNVSKGKLKKFKNLQKVDVYYNHAEKGYKLLKCLGGYEERFLYLVKNHHNDCIIGDKELDILKKYDSMN